MTSLADNTIDELIRRVKASTAVSELHYASEYPPRDLPCPVDEYIVTVRNTGVKVLRQFIGGMTAQGSKGALYECDVVLRVYAPRDSAGYALLRVSSLLADAVEGADTGGAVQEISLAGVVYDDTARTVYRDITVKLGLLLGKEARDD